MQAVATWRRGHEFLLEDGRAHSVVIDLPPEEGGASAGTTPLELSLLALTGSLASTFVSVARKRKLGFSGLTVAVESESPSSSATAGAVRGTLRLRTHADPAEVEKALGASLETCPVARIFRDAHLPVHIEVVLAPAAHPP